MCKSARSYKKKNQKSNKNNPLAAACKDSAYYPIVNGQRVARIKGQKPEGLFSKW